MSYRDRLILQIAEMYYLQNMTQQDIAKAVNMSRPSVSRYLEEARNRKLVEITIKAPLERNHDLAVKLQEKFGLLHCCVVNAGYSLDDPLKLVSGAAAEYIPHILKNDMTIGTGIGGGGLVEDYLSEAIAYQNYSNLHLLQVMGIRPLNMPSHGWLKNLLLLSEKLDASYSLVCAPLYVEDEKVRDYFMNDGHISLIINKIRTVDILLTGIGAVGDPESSLWKSGVIPPEEWEYLVKRGCKCQIHGRMFTDEGVEVPMRTKFVISAPLSYLREIKWVIGIAAGKRKAEAARAAVVNKYINCLFIDDELAQALYEL